MVANIHTKYKIRTSNCAYVHIFVDNLFIGLNNLCIDQKSQVLCISLWIIVGNSSR